MTDTLFLTFQNEDEVRKGRVDVLTVGDSFSQFSNTGYQNYLKIKGVDVANFARCYLFNPVQKVADMIRFGYVDSTNVKTILMEVGERRLIEHFLTVKFDNQTMVEDPSSIVIKDNGKWSLSRTRDYLYYRLNINNINPVLSASLNRDFFSSDDPRKLYFYHNDIDQEVNISQKDAMLIKEKMEILNTLAKASGVEVVMIIPPDKYDIYQGYITNNRYPRKTFNEDLVHWIGENQNILILKDSIAPLVEKGVKDVYLFNDTHWSFKAQKAAAGQIYKRLASRQ
ncbi:MAG: hypothetical protein IKH26_10330 [Bacteroidaceae bacterium]|nr:hypothetical protein [Bacteroidaceae bacterium]